MGGGATDGHTVGRRLIIHRAKSACPYDMIHIQTQGILGDDSLCICAMLANSWQPKTSSSNHRQHRIWRSFHRLSCIQPSNYMSLSASQKMSIWRLACGSYHLPQSAKKSPILCQGYDSFLSATFLS